MCCQVSLLHISFQLENEWPSFGNWFRVWQSNSIGMFPFQQYYPVIEITLRKQGISNIFKNRWKRVLINQCQCQSELKKSFIAQRMSAAGGGGGGGGGGVQQQHQASKYFPPTAHLFIPAQEFQSKTSPRIKSLDFFLTIICSLLLAEVFSFINWDCSRRVKIWLGAHFEYGHQHSTCQHLRLKSDWEDYLVFVLFSVHQPAKTFTICLLSSCLSSFPSEDKNCYQNIYFWSKYFKTNILQQIFCNKYFVT